MADFFRDMDTSRALELESLSRLMYELRHHRARILESARAADEAELLARITSAAVDEHPTYESYLAARILDETREAARSLLADRLAGNDAP